MAIVMMVEDIDMPGRPQQTWYAKDVATLRSVAIAAYEVLAYCVQDQRQAGWKSVGKPSISLPREPNSTRD